jgi:hypothetical protein
MAKFRKKPVTIDGIQYTGDNLGEVLQFVSQHSKTKRKLWADEDGKLCIETLEGVMMASCNDWVIIGVVGEVYPCKPDIFEMTYEKVL